MKPFRLHVGPVVYNVSTERHLIDSDGGRIAGSVTHDMEQVQLEASLPKRSQHVTLIHELLHTIFQQAGQREWYGQEGLLDCLAYGLMGTQIEAEDGDMQALLQPLLAIMEEA